MFNYYLLRYFFRLLLDDYLKHLDPESEDFDDTTQALNIVSEAAEHANNTVKQGVSTYICFFSIKELLRSYT